MANETRVPGRRPYVIAGIGILIEMAAIYLLLVRELNVAVVMPLILIGMFMSFAPVFAKRARDRGG